MHSCDNRVIFYHHARVTAHPEWCWSTLWNSAKNSASLQDCNVSSNAQRSTPVRVHNWRTSLRYLRRFTFPMRMYPQIQGANDIYLETPGCLMIVPDFLIVIIRKYKESLLISVRSKPQAPILPTSILSLSSGSTLQELSVLCKWCILWYLYVGSF